MSEQPSPLRLRKKHGRGLPNEKTAADGARLVAEQSLRDAVVAGLVTVVVFSVLWAALTSLTRTVFPWMTVVLGVLLGFAIRLSGRGVDARFPLLAATLALGGSLLANVVVAAATTAETFDTGTLQVLQAVTGMTWRVFFGEVLNAADGFYALAAAALAAFFANRRLSRGQYYALRMWGEEQHMADKND